MTTFDDGLWTRLVDEHAAGVADRSFLDVRHAVGDERF